jgi:hypothetical protein
MTHGTQGTWWVYIGSGLRRVKHYVQFLVVLIWSWSSEGRPYPPYIGWQTRLVNLDSKSVTIGQTYLLVGYNIILWYLDCLAAHSTSWRVLRVLYRIRSAGEILWKVFGATDHVCWAHCQVGEFYDGLDSLDGDNYEPGQWGPRGTHVSHWLCEAPSPSNRCLWTPPLLLRASSRRRRRATHGSSPWWPGSPRSRRSTGRMRALAEGGTRP